MFPFPPFPWTYRRSIVFCGAGCLVPAYVLLTFSCACCVPVRKVLDQIQYRYQHYSLDFCRPYSRKISRLCDRKILCKAFADVIHQKNLKPFRTFTILNLKTSVFIWITYGILSVFLNIIVSFDLGLKADTSKYGELTWIFPRGAYTFPSRSGPLTPMVSLAYCTISVYRDKSNCACVSSLNCVSDSLKGVKKSRLQKKAWDLLFAFTLVIVFFS